MMDAVEYNQYNSTADTLALPLSDRLQVHLRSITLPLHDINGLMRHILDSLATLKGRLAEEAESTPEDINVFTNSCKMLLDDISKFDPIDNESAINFLVDDAFPDDAKRMDGRGWLPVHWAAAIHSTETEVMKKMISERPVHLLKGHLHCIAPTGDGDIPLNDTFRGLLPLHLIVSLRHPNINNIQQLIDKEPSTVSLADHRGWLPIHWCAYNNRHPEVMQYLLKLYPDGAYEVNKKGKLPFQLAAVNTFTLMLDLLLSENPECIDAIDYNGNTPLHDAAKAFNYEGVKKLLLLQPQLNKKKNFREELPLHRAFSFIPKESSRLHHRQFETIKAILSVNPEAAAIPDRDNALPLHLAIFHHSNIEVVEYVYNIYPSATLIQDNQGKLPVHYATTSDIRTLLLKSAPPLLKAGITDNFAKYL